MHCDEVHHLDDLLVTVAVNGQQGSHTSEQQAAIINTRLGPNGMPVMIHRSAVLQKMADYKSGGSDHDWMYHRGQTQL